MLVHPVDAYFLPEIHIAINTADRHDFNSLSIMLLHDHHDMMTCNVRD